jgi:hypothetical protein
VNVLAQLENLATTMNTDVNAVLSHLLELNGKPVGARSTSSKSRMALVQIEKLAELGQYLVCLTHTRSR